MTQASNLGKGGSNFNSTGQLSLTTGVTGILPVANGGTGTSTGVSPGGSTTQVQYNNAGAFGGSANLVWDNTNAYLGIGTASPAYKLDVISGSSYIAHFSDGSTASVSIQKDSIVFGNAAPSAYSTGNYDASTHVFKISNTERMRITSAGYVGIGTSSPPQLFSVHGTSDPAINVRNTSGSIDANFYCTTTNAVIGTSGSGSLLLHTGNTTRFQIGSAGQLGIGGATYGTSGQVLTSGGASAAPTWSAGPAMVLVGQQTVSAISSVAFDNVFSATYDNYFINCTLVSSGSSGLQMYPRAGGTNTTTNLSRQRGIFSGSTISAGSASTWLAMFAVGTNLSPLQIWINSPFKTENTTFTGINMQGTEFYSGCGRNASSTSFDGIYFECPTFTITGTIKIYGIVNS